MIGGPGAFAIVADTHADFARAIRKKLILEIANKTPDLREILERRAYETRPRNASPRPATAAKSAASSTGTKRTIIKATLLCRHSPEGGNTVLAVE